MDPTDPTPPPDPRDPLERPSLQAALVLLVPGALCAGLFYLWLGKPGEALAYGGLIGCGLAAITVEFVKYARSVREHPGEHSSAAGAVLGLALAAFRVGFMKTAWELGRELVKLVGLKVIASVVFALVVYLIARAEHLF